MHLTIAKYVLYASGLGLPMVLAVTGNGSGIDYMEAGAFGVVCFLLIRSHSFLINDLKRTLGEIRDALKENKK